MARTEAQQRAFQKCLNARKANLLKQALDEAGIPDPSAAPEPAPAAAAPPAPAPEPIAAPAPAPHMDPTPAAAEEVEEIDVTDLFNEISSLRNELNSQRDTVSGLSNRFQQHEELKQHQIRFV